MFDIISNSNIFHEEIIGPAWKALTLAQQKEWKDKAAEQNGSPVLVPVPVPAGAPAPVLGAKPKKPLSGYMMYANHRRAELKGKGVPNMLKVIGPEWKALPAETKKEWIARAKVEAEAEVKVEVEAEVAKAE